MSKNSLSCAIISVYPFPNGMAATNRILAYSKGLVNENVNVNIFIPIPLHRTSEIEINDLPAQGVFEGINYDYVTGKFSSRWKIFRIISILTGFRFFNGFLKTCKALFKVNKRNRLDAIIISTDDLKILFAFSMAAKFISVPIVFIFDEFPIPIRHKLKNKIPKWKAYLYKIVLKKITRYISISEELREYYNSICKKETLILPIITDTSRFENLNLNSFYKNQKKYLCYMGNMELTKDNVDLIIKAFAMIEGKYPKLDLYLYGQPHEQTKTYLKKLVWDLNLNDRVFFKGRVSSQYVPEILTNAHVLVSSQPNSKRASGGFPTKLGEYLVSGTPSLLTNVGENSRFAKDGIHLFFCPPDDPELYAIKLSFILSNYQEAKRVAENGRQLIVENYSHNAMGRRLKKFINQIHQ